jgi:regulator of protease activity HflC (stomatin/prohibitin superfamily)
MNKLLVLILTSMLLSSCGALRDYERTQIRLDSENNGKAALLEAENSKKVTIETAKANVEAAKLNAEADIIRAKGIAESNRIIGHSLNNNKAYLEWLWIDNIEKNPNAVFYIPTENKVPIFNFRDSVLSPTTTTKEKSK